MTRTVILWALVLAAGAFLLQWLEYQYLVRALPREIYVAVIGAAFAAGCGLGGGAAAYDGLRRQQGDRHCRRQCAGQDQRQDVDPAKGAQSDHGQAPDSWTQRSESWAGKMRPSNMWQVKMWSSHNQRPRQGRRSDVGANAITFYLTSTVEF